jgi:signal transduction histidine kinase
MSLAKDGANHSSTGDTQVEATRQMDGAWRAWETLRQWDARFAWAVDTAVSVGLFAFCTGWFFKAGPMHPDLGFVAALTLPLMVRRRAPFTVFAGISVVALIQLLTISPLLADTSLLVALYTVAARSDWMRVVISLLVLQIGIIAATAHWVPIGSYFESLVFLTGMGGAAFLAGTVVRALGSQIDWLAERAQRLELERDQQASLSAAAERARIAREMHDVISHNLQVMVTLADAACIAQSHSPARASEAMGEVATTGRQAMTDMRRMLGLLREEAGIEMASPHEAPILAPQPGLEELESLVERVRTTGLWVDVSIEGEPFDLSGAAQLTIFRIVQEALTNALRHSGSSAKVVVELAFSQPDVSLRITDDGHGLRLTPTIAPALRVAGHGVSNMAERAAVFGGMLTAGPLPDRGWRVETTLHGCQPPRGT